MKYIVILGDGMSDEPLEALGGKSPLEYANTPAMDALASAGEMGNMMNLIGGFTVLRFTSMLGMRNISFTKEELLKLNSKLNKIRKPR